VKENSSIGFAATWRGFLSLWSGFYVKLHEWLPANEYIAHLVQQ
jgi:hypothetical protein